MNIRPVSRIGVAAAVAIPASFVGGWIGFLIARVLVEGLDVVEGPAAGVFLNLCILTFAVIGGFVGTFATWRRTRKRWEGQ